MGHTQWPYKTSLQMVGAGPLYKTKIVSSTFHNCIGQVKFLGGKWNFDATCPTGQVAKNLILHHWYGVPKSLWFHLTRCLNANKSAANFLIWIQCFSVNENTENVTLLLRKQGLVSKKCCKCNFLIEKHNVST